MNLETAIETIFENEHLEDAYGEWLMTESDCLIGNGDMLLRAVDSCYDIGIFVEYAIKKNLFPKEML
jgi:hypothetical protein